MDSARTMIQFQSIPAGHYLLMHDTHVCYISITNDPSELFYGWSRGNVHVLSYEIQLNKTFMHLAKMNQTNCAPSCQDE